MSSSLFHIEFLGQRCLRTVIKRRCHNQPLFMWRPLIPFLFYFVVSFCVFTLYIILKRQWASDHSQVRLKYKRTFSHRCYLITWMNQICIAELFPTQQAFCCPVRTDSWCIIFGFFIRVVVEYNSFLKLKEARKGD